ncbi:MAG TPA: mRNA surveillance protein pelota [Candidatus Bathyarchaeia archaeon]|nr:mRNA surveillance protein pelota [Candidatus Bathyarchaeia archaeon]
MRLLKKSLVKCEGEIRLLPESIDDLWHLKHLVEKGDLVFALTFRKVESASDKLRPEKPERKPMRLGIRVESVEFHRFANRLRIGGVIESGQDAGSYHTFSIEPLRDVSIIKRWRRDEIDRIEKAMQESNRPEIAIVTIESGLAQIGVLRQYGVEEVASIAQSTGKRNEGSQAEFFARIYDQLLSSGAQNYIVAGPGFIKDDFVRFATEKDATFRSRLTVENTTSVGISGFQEVLRRGAVDRLIKDAHLAREARLIDALLQEIAINGKAAYGMAEVVKALEWGAVDTLLIADETLRGEREKGTAIDDLLTAVTESDGHVVVFSTDFEPGKRLEKLGGIAALLRFKLQDG